MVLFIIHNYVLEMNSISLWLDFLVIIFLYFLFPLLFIMVLLLLNFNWFFLFVFFHAFELFYEQFNDLVFWIRLFENNIAYLHEKVSCGLLRASDALVNDITVSIYLRLVLCIFPLFALNRLLFISHILQMRFQSDGQLY